MLYNVICQYAGMQGFSQKFGKKILELKTVHTRQLVWITPMIIIYDTHILL